MTRMRRNSYDGVFQHRWPTRKSSVLASRLFQSQLFRIARLEERGGRVSRICTARPLSRFSLSSFVIHIRGPLFSHVLEICSTVENLPRETPYSLHFLVYFDSATESAYCTFYSSCSDRPTLRRLCIRKINQSQRQRITIAFAA